VGRRNATNVNCYYINLGTSGSDNNAFSLRHNASNDATFASGVVIRFRDGSGNINTMGYTDTSITNKLRTFRLGGATNKIFSNGVEQSLTVPVGSNTGQSFADVTASATVGIGIVQGTGSALGTQWNKMMLITDPLTESEMTSLLQYCTEEGMI